MAPQKEVEEDIHHCITFGKASIVTLDIVYTIMYTYSVYNWGGVEMSAVHINITIPATLKKQLDVSLSKIKMKRSTFIQEAISYYLKERNTRRLAKDLEKGYQAMALENEKTSGEWFNLEEEVI